IPARPRARDRCPGYQRRGPDLSASGGHARARVGYGCAMARGIRPSAQATSAPAAAVCLGAGGVARRCSRPIHRAGRNMRTSPSTGVCAMRRQTVFLAASLAALALAGCAGTSKVMLGQARPPIDPSQVQIYSVPPPGSQDVAQLEASSAVGFGTQGQTDAAVARLKREAAALGANGVVLMGVGSSGSPVGMSVGA